VAHLPTCVLKSADVFCVTAPMLQWCTILGDIVEEPQGGFWPLGCDLFSSLVSSSAQTAIRLESHVSFRQSDVPDVQGCSVINHNPSL